MRHPRLVLLTLALLATFTLAATGDQRAPAPPSPAAAPATQAEIERRLADVIPLIKIDNQPLDKVFYYLGKNRNTTFHIQWPQLAAVGVTPDTTISVDLKDVPLSRALDLILAEAGGGVSSLDYAPLGNTVVISTADALRTAAYQVTRAYDCRQLLRHLAPQLHPSEDPMALVSETVQQVVDPETWQEYGGTSGRITHTGHTLIVTQTIRNHEAVANLLADMAAPRALPKDTPTQARHRAEAEVQKKLTRPIVVDIESVPLEEAIQKLGDMLNIHIAVGWKHLPDGSLARTTPITFKTHTAMPASQVLTLLMEAISTPKCHMDWSPDDASVVIAPTDALEQVRVYYLSGQTRAPFINSYTDLLDFITRTIDTDTWRANGGTIGTIRELNNCLIINQTPRNHERIATLLQDLGVTGAEK